ncbi:hypothetical protein Pmani_037439 [Petrolisthes manimaculis]|uniref:NACHT domain-containing protein n=1 Tax=Petrolisthes manimaculis TaxID=1843537 RepID=A0AAE1TLF3_9EUCA|nr:hypothetical protein Pmani_037439 [Petrolisthes manimaculis]
MSLQRSPKGISDEDKRILRLFKIIMSEGHHALLLVYEWGYLKKHSGTSLIEHLKDKGMSKQCMKKYFDTTMRETMSEDPSGETYDVSLLFACIMYGCEGLASSGSPDWRGDRDDKLEGLCTYVKNFRNSLTHGKSIKDEKALKEQSLVLTSKLESLILLAASDTYYNQSQEEVDKKIAEMKTNIDKIMDAPLGYTETIDFMEAIKKLKEEQKKIVTEMGNTFLPEHYKALSRVDPASFITGKDRLEVKQIFTRLEVIHEKKAAPHKEEEEIDYRDLLTIKSDEKEDREPTIVVVEGDAGAGKTTLSKLVLNDWADFKTSETKEPVQFHSLDTYELVLFAEGRNKFISNFASLLKFLMPHAEGKLDDNGLVKAVLGMKTLLILDGLDELNAESESLITEILGTHVPASENRLHLLITTRPHMVDELPLIGIHSHPMVHLRLKGISPDKWEEFVEKVHITMIENGLSKQNTKHLVEYVRRSRGQMGEHYRLPLNLTLLTYLWAADPSRVNSVTTVTELYKALLKLIILRLVERLKKQSNLHKSYKSKTELKQLCKQFLQTLCKACLQTLQLGYVQLSNDSVDELRNRCEDLNLKFEEMTGPFLNVEKEWTAYGYTFELFVPHKSIMEFYAARSFLYPLKTSFHDEPDKEVIIRNLVQQLLKKDPENDDLSPFENVFIHLGGLLAHKKDPTILEKCAKELIYIFEKIKMLESKWLEFITECKCNSFIAELVAQDKIHKLRVRDGHTLAALALLPHLLPQTPVEIILETEVQYVPMLEELHEEVAKRPCNLEVLLKHQWKNPACGVSDQHLTPVLNKAAKCQLLRVTGYLEEVINLPDTVRKLRLSFIDDAHANKLIEQIKNHDMILEYLGIHVMEEVCGDIPEPLPMISSLWISRNNSEDLDRVVKVVKSLCPPENDNIPSTIILYIITCHEPQTLSHPIAAPQLPSPALFASTTLFTFHPPPTTTRFS